MHRFADSRRRATLTPRREQALGVGVTLIVLLDIFLTVLYARMGTGLLSPWIARLVWRTMRSGASAFGRRRGAVLAFCGPIILVSLVAVWTLGLTLGTALIIHPALGTGVRVSDGPTPTDFVAALYAGGTSLAITGSSEFSPQTSGWRLFYLLPLAGRHLGGLADADVSHAGVHRAAGAQRAGLQLHAQSGETADAAELLAGLGPPVAVRAGVEFSRPCGTCADRRQTRMCSSSLRTGVAETAFGGSLRR